MDSFMKIASLTVLPFSLALVAGCGAQPDDEPATGEVSQADTPPQPTPQTCGDDNSPPVTSPAYYPGWGYPGYSYPGYSYPGTSYGYPGWGYSGWGYSG